MMEVHLVAEKGWLAGNRSHPEPLAWLQRLRLTGLLLLLALFSLTRLGALRRAMPLPFQPPVPGPVWGTKPVLAYFTLTPSLVEVIHQEGVLAPDQLRAVQQVARYEQERLQALEQESQAIIGDASLTMEQKRAKIREMGYNARVQDIIRGSQEALRRALDADTYRRFVNWIERRWKVERLAHGKVLVSPGPRSFRVYATRYDSKGAYTVALPDKCLKFANAGNHVCDDDGYAVGQRYSVIISYQGSVGVLVGESGPWNVDDNYWSSVRDPQPRRMFTDLALGMPEAQAAYFNGYNGGKDQFGRTVTAPYGIDLARQVSIDIGLQPGVNDWITVSFMWTEGWDGAPPSMGGTPGIPASTSLSIVPVQVATPNPQGEVIHVVQPGQSLWSIAIAYKVTIQEILELNKRTDTTIRSGEKLLIKTVSATLTPTRDKPITKTAVAQETSARQQTQTSAAETAMSIALAILTQTGETPQPEATPPVSGGKGYDPILIASLALLGVGGLLLLFGRFLDRGK